MDPVHLQSLFHGSNGKSLVESLQAAMGLSWFVLGYADSGQEKAQSVFKDILSSRRKKAYHEQEEERPYIALGRSRIPHTFQSFKGFGHHILKSSDKKKKKQVVNKIWKQLRNLLAKIRDKKPPAEMQPLLYILLCSASSFLKCMGHRASVTPLA